MDELSKLLVIFSVIFIALGVLFISESNISGSDSNLRIIFCDVGQGDGILVLTPNGDQVVIDGGPRNKMIDCLGEYMPFNDRIVEVMIMTHPQKDHMEGQIGIFESYEVERVGWSGVKNDTAVFDRWFSLLELEESEQFVPKAGDKIVIEKADFDILWPTQSNLDFWATNPPSDLNDVSVVTRLSFGDFCAYLTGDLDKEFLENILDRECEVLKISHHGSKTGTNQELLDLVSPEVAVIQVGKNRFGHPTDEVLDILTSYHVEILRNDIDNTIEVESNGTSYFVNQ